MKDLEEAVAGAQDMDRAKRLNLLMLQTFYLEPYEREEDFYGQFSERLERYEADMAGSFGK